MEKRFTGRNVVITGASGGLGRGLALGFGREGAHLVLADNAAAGLQETAGLLAAEGITASTHAVNLASEAEIKVFGAEICALHERIDVLLNNAGIAYGEIHAPIETIPLEKWLLYYSVNTLAPLILEHGAGIAARFGEGRWGDHQPDLFRQLHPRQCLWHDQAGFERDDFGHGLCLRQG